MNFRLFSTLLQLRHYIDSYVASSVRQQLWVVIDRLTKIVFIGYLLYCFRGSQITRYSISGDSMDALECSRMLSRFSDLISHSCTIDNLCIANIKT